MKKFKKVLLIITIFLCIFITQPNIVLARDWYVNNQNPYCNDLGTGTIDVPLCTVSTANDRHSAGDTVYIMPGEYREYILPKSGNSNAQMTVYSGYGNPEDVKIIGSDVVSGWQQYNGNVYRASFTAPERCGLNASTNCWEDRTRWYTPVNSSSEVNIPGEYYFDGNYIYLYSWSGTPQNHLIECSKRLTAPFGAWDGMYRDGKSNPTQYYAIKNLTIMNSHRRGITIQGNSHDILIKNNIFKFNSGCRTGAENPSSIYKDASDPPTPNIYIIGNIVYDQGTDTGFYGSSAPGASEHYGTGIELYSVYNSVVENNTIYRASYGFFMKSGRGTHSYWNLTVKNNIIHDVGVGIAVGRNINKLVNLPGVFIERNIIYNTPFGGIIFNWENNSGLVDKNTLYNVSANNFGAIRMAGTSGEGHNYNTMSEVNFTNNIIFNTNTQTMYFEFRCNQTYWVYSDYNLVFNKTGYFGITYPPLINYNTHETWKAGTGHDLHSIETNPLFVNAIGRNFSLQEGSPAIDTGIIIQGYHCPQSDDINPNQQNCRHWSGSAPDIGAIEYSSIAQTACILPFDFEPCNCINNTELFNTINAWNFGQITIQQLITNIKTWKQCSN
ncbi:MAG: right-handed parallel beta-helix repeat-containing protein [Candidatus Woesearchaeota archaeon]